MTVFEASGVRASAKPSWVTLRETEGGVAITLETSIPQTVSLTAEEAKALARQLARAAKRHDVRATGAS